MTDLTPAAEALLREIDDGGDGWLEGQLLKVQAEARATAEAEIAELRAMLDRWDRDADVIQSALSTSTSARRSLAAEVLRQCAADARRLLAAPPAEPRE